MTSKQLGEKVKSKINGQGRTLAWVSEQVGLSRSSLSQRLAGKPEFKFSELQGISKALSLGENYNWFSND